MTFPGRPGSHAPQRRVVVSSLGVRGRHGHEVLVDASGRLRVEITEDGVVLPGTGDGPWTRALPHAEPLP
ncbi:DUF6296 family protein [Kitasatospora sp. NPDC059571]|uniref:DUF6296 family protein n=1 Tax=Kitasatospora sp. NPDC059571 TaxID=3346871 RepID=UPI0036CB7BCA